jgi:hypothetical protein
MAASVNELQHEEVRHGMEEETDEVMEAEVDAELEAEKSALLASRYHRAIGSGRDR